MGGPTIILDKPGTDSAEQNFLGDLASEVYILSKPAVGKHICFRGDLLHAASSDFEQEESPDDSSESESESSENRPKRITFLVNIWLNHTPSHAGPVDVNLLSAFKQHTFEEDIVLSEPAAAPYLLDSSSSSQHRSLRWTFTSSYVMTEIALPAPSAEEIKCSFKQHSSVFIDSRKIESHGSLSEIILCVVCSSSEEYNEDSDNGSVVDYSEEEEEEEKDEGDSSGDEVEDNGEFQQDNILANKKIRIL